MARKKMAQTSQTSQISQTAEDLNVAAEGVAAEGGALQLITVDAWKLSRALKTTFEGVSMVFDSIGVPVSVGMPGVKDTDEKVAVSGEEEKAGATTTTGETATDAENKTTAEVEKTIVEEKDAPAENGEADAGNEAKAMTESVIEPVAEPSKPASQAVPAISIDDITKIIVQKIKQNRKNNEKIGAILKTYGIAKVSDLPADKYEAFLTDLSAI